MASTLRVKGLGGRELARDLDALQLGASRELGSIRAEAGRRVAAQARRHTPVGPGPRPGDPLPHIRDTITGTATGVRSTHPAALVHEHGGEIRPRGVPIRIPRSAMAGRAAEQSRGAIEDLAAARMDALLTHLT